MSWIGRVVEENLARAAADGELDTPHLRGHTLDLDAQRSPGWWAERFVRRERSHDRRAVAEVAASRARAGFWRAETVEELRALVRDANVAVVRANVDLVESDRLVPFQPADIETRWHALRRPR